MLTGEDQPFQFGYFYYWKNRSLIPGRRNRFLSSRGSTLALGPNKSAIEWVPEIFPEKIKRSVCEGEYLPQSNVETPSYITSPSNLIMVQLSTEANLPFHFVSVAV
jgi:hypothetical protein